MFSFLLIFKKIYLFIWLSQVLVVAQRIFHLRCGRVDLLSWNVGFVVVACELSVVIHGI